jgi:hypothetical protein
MKTPKSKSKVEPAETHSPDSLFELIGVKSILEQLRPHETAGIEFHALADTIRKKQQVTDAAFLLNLARLAIGTLNQVCHDVPQVFQPIAAKSLF